MVKKKRKFSSKDLSNNMVLTMLVLVIVVSTVSIILFMDATADAKITVVDTVEGTASLTIEEPPTSVESESFDSSGEASVTIVEPTK